MTRKFNYENELRNYYLFNENGSKYEKENTERQMRKSLGKERISNNLKRVNELNVLRNKIQSENIIFTGGYGLKKQKRKTYKPRKKFHKINFKHEINKLVDPIKRKESRDQQNKVNKISLTPKENHRSPRIRKSYSNGRVQVKESFYTFLHGLKRSTKEKKNLLSCEKYIRLKVKSLSPK